jgi:ATP-dependent RNA helicase TDRD9
MAIAIEEMNLSLKRLGFITAPTVNVAPLSYTEKCRLLQYAIFGAFYPNYFLRKRGSTKDLREVHKTLFGQDPMTTVYMHGFPQGQGRDLPNFALCSWIN